jgi:predicted tellurium resistance membrane protein TerC
MLELLSSPEVWAAFATLTVMEVVLGIDNIVFISVLVARLPKEQADRARRWGIGLALVFRIVLLLFISWIISLDEPLEFFASWGIGLRLSWRDLILLAGGAFLIYKATHEIHAEVEEPHTADLGRQASMAFSAIIAQIIVIDMVFSIDSIVTAVGMAEHVEVMIAAVIVAVTIMFLASGPIAQFVADHPTTKMLALAFLLLIGVSLVVDAFEESYGFHIPKGYIYAAMAFSVLVEAMNIFAKQRRRKKLAAEGGHAPVTLPTHTLASDAAEAIAGTGGGAPPSAAKTSAAAAPQPRTKATPAKRARAAPKSAPRKKK